MQIKNELAASQNSSFLLRTSATQQNGDDADVSTALLMEAQRNIVRAETPSYSPPRNLMEGSFVKQDFEQSRYVKGMMIGFQVENEFKNKLNGIVESYKLQADMVDSYAEKNMIGKKAAKAAKDFVDGEAVEEAVEKMKEDQKKEEEVKEKKEKEALENGEEAEKPGDDPEIVASEAEKEAEAVSGKKDGQEVLDGEAVKAEPAVEKVREKSENVSQQILDEAAAQEPTSDAAHNIRAQGEYVNVMV